MLHPEFIIFFKNKQGDDAVKLTARVIQVNEETFLVTDIRFNTDPATKFAEDHVLRKFVYQHIVDWKTQPADHHSELGTQIGHEIQKMLNMKELTDAF